MAPLKPIERLYEARRRLPRNACRVYCTKEAEREIETSDVTRQLRCPSLLLTNLPCLFQSVIPFCPAQACVAPYLAVIGRQHGISAAQMAVILGIMPLVAAAIKPICGYVIDRTQNATAVVLVLLLMLASFTGAVFMSPRSGTEAKYTEGLLDCSRGTFTAVDPSSELFPGFQGKSSAYLQCTLYFLDDVMLPVEVQGGSATEVELVNASLTCGALDNRNPTTWNANATARLSCRCDSCSVVVKNVWLYAVSIVITGAVSTTLYTVSDSATCELLNDNPRAYGRQRLWGSTGWGIISTVIGFYMGKASSGGDGHTDYTPGF